MIKQEIKLHRGVYILLIFFPPSLTTLDAELGLAGTWTQGDGCLVYWD